MMRHAGGPETETEMFAEHTRESAPA
jgi:hypothetical protein